MRSVSTMQEAFLNARNSQLDRWLSIARSARQDSDVVCELLRQPGGETHLVRLVASYAPATLSAYFNCWDQWVSFCAVVSETQFSPSLRVLLDFLQVHARGTSQSAVGWITVRAYVLWSKTPGPDHLLLQLQRTCDVITPDVVADDEDFHLAEAASPPTGE